RAFRPTHGPNHLLVLGARLAEQLLALSTQARVRVLVELVLPFFEQVVCDALHVVDAIGDGLRPRFAALVRRIEAIVNVLQIPAVEADDAAVLIERRLELLLGGVLCVPRVLDAVDENVPLLDADRLERLVVRRRAAGEKQNRGEGRKAGGRRSRRVSHRIVPRPMIERGSKPRASCGTAAPAGPRICEARRLAGPDGSSLLERYANADPRGARCTRGEEAGIVELVAEHLIRLPEYAERLVLGVEHVVDACEKPRRIAQRI